MKVLVIVVIHKPIMGRTLWKTVKDAFSLEDSINFHPIPIAKDKKAIVFKQTEENIIKDIIKDIIESLKSIEKPESCIFTHDDDINNNENISHIESETGSRIKRPICEYTNTPNRQPFEKIKTFITSLKESNKESLFNDLWEYQEKKGPEKLRSHLLHLFLPLDIDMQALEALKEDKQEQVNYLERMVKEVNELINKEGKEKGLFTAKLTEAQKEAIQLLDQISDTQKKEDVKKHLSSDEITDFVNKLDCLLSNKDSGLNQKEIIEKAPEFNHWYRDLDKALKSL